MPTYSINMNAGDPSQGWNKAASSLARALTPDYEGQANAALRGAQMEQAYAGASANSALARERNATAAGTERINEVWGDFDAMMGQEVPYEDKLKLFPEYLMRLGEVNGGNLGDFALASAGIQNAAGPVASRPNPTFDPERPVSVFNPAETSGPKPMFDETAMQNLQLGSGMSMGNTIEGFREGEQNQAAREIANQTLENEGAMARTVYGDQNELVQVVRDGQPAVVPKKDLLPGETPIVSETNAKGFSFLNELTENQRKDVQMDGVGERAKSDLVTIDRTFADGTVKNMTVMAEDVDPNTDVMVSGTASTRAPDNYAWRNPETGRNETFRSVDGVTDVYGRPVPPEAYKVGVSGTPQETGVDLSEAEARNARFLTRMAPADLTINNMVDAAEGELPVSDLELFLSMASQGRMVWSMLVNKASSAETQAYVTASFNFLSAALRADTGAAAPVTEYPMYYLMFIPMPGDQKPVIQAKRVAREVMMDSIRAGLPRSTALENLINGAGQDAIATLMDTPGGRELVEMNGGLENMLVTTLDSIEADGNDVGIQQTGTVKPRGPAGAGESTGVDAVYDRDENGNLVRIK